MANKTIYNNENSLREFNNNRNKKSSNKNKNKSSKNSKHNNNNNNNNNNKNNSNNNKSYKIITYNIKIGEGNFCLSSESLNRDAPNFFTAAFFGYFSESKKTSIFIERDPIYFNMIVKYLRGYEVEWPVNDKVSMNNLLADVRFYGFEKLQNFLEKIYRKNFPKNIIPWKILTYAPEKTPVVILNIKDVELKRWNSHSLIYDTNPILKNKKSTPVEDNNADNVTNNDETANIATGNNIADNGNNDQNNDQNNENNADNIIEPNPKKGLYRLEIHGRDASATVTSNNNNGVKFENFTLKDPKGDEVFCTLTKSFRTSEGSLTLSPSLKLPFLKDACIEIDGSKYYNYNDLSAYFGVATKGKPLYFEEIVIRIDNGVFLMRARAWTTPFYYASQPFVDSVRLRRF